MLKVPAPARGVSLIELLVSLVIASLGLLTLVALQAASLRYTQVSQRRADVTLLAEFLMERLRVNTADASGLSAYEFSSSFSAQAAAPPGAPPVLCNSATSNCTVVQMAEFDLYTWRTLVRSQLPGGAVLSKVTQGAASAGAAGQAGSTGAAPAPTYLDLWIAWRDPVQHQAAGTEVRPAGECPDELQLDTTLDATVRCLRWRVRR